LRAGEFIKRIAVLGHEEMARAGRGVTEPQRLGFPPRILPRFQTLALTVKCEQAAAWIPNQHLAAHYQGIALAANTQLPLPEDLAALGIDGRRQADLTAQILRHHKQGLA